MKTQHLYQWRTKNRRWIPVAITALLLGISACLVFGCSPQITTSTTNSQSQISFELTTSTDCTVCHKTELASESNSSCYASQHASAGVACVQCHAVTDNLKSEHVSATAIAQMPTKLSTQDAVAEATCLGCHGSYEALAAKTTNVTVLTDETGTIVNPHAVPKSVSQHQGVTCTTCHSIHKASGNPKDYCLSCHHEDVFQCYTCHE
jgi:hypothetical protein